MDYGKFRCRHCGKRRRRRTAEQSYCGASACQKARKNAWRRAKYSTDADYRANQRESTNTWLEEQGGSAAYHRAYRRRLKGSMSAEAMSAVRSKKPTSTNSDADIGSSLLETGVYVLTPVTTDSDANSDALLAKIEIIPGYYLAIANIDSIGEDP